MNCEEVNELLIDYVEGELPKRQTLDIARHLEQCSGCAQEVSEMESVIDTVSLTVEDPGDSYFASIFPRVMERIEQNEGLPWYKKLFKGRSPVLRWSAVGAPVALTILMLLFTFIPQTLPVDSDSADKKAPTLVARMKINPTLLRSSTAADEVADLSDSEVDLLHNSLMAALEEAIHEDNILKEKETATVLPHNTAALPAALDGMDNEALGTFMEKLSEMEENII